MRGKIVVAFDLYGTLLSTESIAARLETYFGPSKAQSIAALWRRYQLEYTWRLNCMERYESFFYVTRNALEHALGDHGEQLAQEDIAKLMEAYDSLSTFPDVTPALNRLGNHADLHAVIFSNGTHEMISNSVLRSKDLSQHANQFHDLLSVDDVQRFKPSRASYASLAVKMGKRPNQMHEIWLISGNPFDITGARSMGMNAIWVDRAGKGWQDAAASDLKPTAIVHSLEHLVEEITSRKK